MAHLEEKNIFFVRYCFLENTYLASNKVLPVKKSCSSDRRCRSGSTDPALKCKITQDLLTSPVNILLALHIASLAAKEPAFYPEGVPGFQYRDLSNAPANMQKF